MPDILCQTCDEPWSAHHLRHDAIHDTDLPETACRAWGGRLTSRIRRALERAGYRFGATIYSLRSCPCCPRGAVQSAAGRRRAELTDAAESLLGDDLDGLQAELLDCAE